MVFKLTHDDDLFYGQAIEVKLSAKNISARNRRTVKAVTFYYHRQKYTGEQGKLLMKDAIPLEADLKPGESESNNNPFTPNGFSKSFQLNQSIPFLKGRWGGFFFYNHATSNLAIYFHETSQDKLPEA